MAELTQIEYRGIDTLVHRLDVRVKILYLAVFSLISVYLSWGGLSVQTIIIIAAAISVNISIASLAKEMRVVVFLMLFVLAARSLSVSDITFRRFDFIVFSLDGFLDGLIYCWRLTLIILMGAILVAGTRSSEIRAGIQWFLKPIPFVPHKKAGMMIGLIVRFVPVIVHQVVETDYALRARGLEARKNPIYRMIKIGPPLVRRIFLQADRLTTAMEARCYNEDRTEPDLSATKADGLGLAVLVCLSSILIYIS